MNTIDWKNGFTPIASIIIDHLMKIRIPGEAAQVLWYIFRYTYGNKNQKWCPLKNKVICEYTGLSKFAVSKSIKKLEQMNLIIKKNGQISFNKYFETWIKDGHIVTPTKKLPKKATTKKLPKKATKVVKKGNTSLYIIYNIYSSFYKAICTFGDTISMYDNFNIHLEDDLKWFVNSIGKNENYNGLNLDIEIEKWANWLEVQYRKKQNKEKNRFPKSNYKNSLINWLEKAKEFKNGSNRQNVNSNVGNRNGSGNTKNPADIKDFEPYGTGVQESW